MNETVVTSVAEFQARLQELESDEAGLLYRGQADAGWPVSCSAARRLRNDPANPVEGQLINSLLVGYLEYLIAKARMRGFLPPGFSETSPDLELLAQLQHQGAATGLIDFTRQPSVALWVACNDAYEKDGAVYVLPRSATEEISNSRDLEKQIQSFYEGGTLWSWEPSARGNRIVAQSSVFVFGVAAVSSHRMERFIIRADCKRDILTQLDAVYGINEEVLFSDFPGYAVANAANKAFDIRRSVSYWREQVELASDDGEREKAYFRCGVAYSAIKEFESAITHFDAAIEINRSYAAAYINRGNCKMGLGRHEEAIVDFDAAVRINPESAEAYNNRGGAKIGIGRHEGAIVDFDAAIGIDPEYAEAYNNRGKCKVGLGRREEAIVDFDEPIRINPEYAEAYNNRGGAKVDLGRHEEAIVDFDAAIHINPECAEAFNNRAVAKASLGRREEAIVDFDLAIGIAPRNAGVYINRGLAKAELGRYEEAIADYDVAIGINPKRIEAYVNRGESKKLLRQLSEAREDFERARTLAQEQGQAVFLQTIAKELNELHGDSAISQPIQVAPHRSGYVPGVDSEKLKDILGDVDDHQFTGKDAT